MLAPKHIMTGAPYNDYPCYRDMQSKAGSRHAVWQLQAVPTHEPAVASADQTSARHQNNMAVRALFFAKHRELLIHTLITKQSSLCNKPSTARDDLGTSVGHAMLGLQA